MPVPIKGNQPRAQKNVSPKVLDAQIQAAQDIADGLIAIMRSKDRVASGDTIRSVNIIITGRGQVGVAAARTVVFTLFGRRRGRQPPPKTMEEWIRVKPLRPEPGVTISQLAFLIGRKIGREGIRAVTTDDAVNDLIEKSNARQALNISRIQAEFISEITLNNFTKSGAYKVK